MTLVTFIRDFDYVPTDHTHLTYVYTAGDTVPVPDECAKRAVSLGFADYEIDEDDA